MLNTDSDDIIFKVCQDIKYQIASKTQEAYIWFATHDSTFIIDRQEFIRLFTVHTITDTKETWSLFGKFHREGLPAVKYNDGTTIYYYNGEVHSEGTQPSIITPDGAIIYHTHGKLNSRFFNDKLQPSFISPNDDKRWFLNGKLHRGRDHNGKILPAIEQADGGLIYCWHGKDHREHNLPTSVLSDGTLMWQKNDQIHRDTCEHSSKCKCGNVQPALIKPNGDKYWLINNEPSRDNDLPVVEYSNGTKMWCVNGKLVPGYDIRDMI